MFSDLAATINPTVTAVTTLNNATGNATSLLPMAFQEGSPMHPSYGAGHATVAGACVTILKAFFDTSCLFVVEVDRILSVVIRLTILQLSTQQALTALV